MPYALRPRLLGGVARPVRPRSYQQPGPGANADGPRHSARRGRTYTKLVLLKAHEHTHAAIQPACVSAAARISVAAVYWDAQHIDEGIRLLKQRAQPLAPA